MTLVGHSESVHAVAIVPKSEAEGEALCASASADMTIRVWDLLAGGAALHVLCGHTYAVYCLTSYAHPPDGELRLISGSGTTQTSDLSIFTHTS